MVNKLDGVETLSDLPQWELVLVSVPETSAARRLRMVTNAVTLEPHVRVTDGVLKALEVERRVLTVNACRTRLGLYLKNHDATSLSGSRQQTR